MILVRLLALSSLPIATSAAWAGYSQRSALQLRQEQQSAYWPRHGTSLSGGYSRGVWIMTPSRSDYGGFRGGGPGSGK
ncbi:hypothetical protein [Baaleninema sp.]|uniref:hypothetical protein n=1 Tax=Baaleninema sp. TaxID=3101197 RepID=UPI003D06C59F